MNCICLTARIVRDVELKKSKNGTAYAQFQIAFNVFDGGKDAMFINCTAFGTVAEHLGKYGQKGKQLAVQGRITQSKYKDFGGNEIKKVIIVVRNVTFMYQVASSPKEPPLEIDHPITPDEVGLDDANDKDLPF